MDVGDYYSRSFDNLKDNLNIAVPSLVGTVLTFIIMAIIVLIIMFGFIGTNAFFNGVITPENVPNISIMAVLISAALLFIFGIITALIYSFIYAATIGMAKKVIEGGRPDLEVAWKKGKKYFIKIFVVSIITALIGIVLAIPFILGIILFNISDILGIIVSMLGILIFIVGLILLALGLMFVNQAIVIGKKSVIGSIKSSFKLFMKNKLKVFLVGIINFAIALGISFVLGLIPFVGSILNILAGIILTPYFVLVITYLYMDIKGISPVDEYQ